MLRIKFFVVGLIFLVSCLCVKDMESKNKTTEKPNEINLKVEDKNKVFEEKSTPDQAIRTEIEHL